MRKSLVAVLTAGLLLLGVSPVWAAGQAMELSVPGAEEVVSIPVPSGAAQLGDEELAQVDGQGLIGAIAGAIGGAIGGAVTGAIGSYLHSGHVDWRDVVAGAVGGAVGGAIGGAIAGP